MEKLFGIRNKILVLMLLTCFLPFIGFSVLVYRNYWHSLETNTINNFRNDVVQNERLIFSNVWLVEYAAKQLSVKPELQEMLKNGCSTDEYVELIGRTVEGISHIKSIVAFDNMDNQYVYGEPVGAKDKIDFTMISGRNGMSSEHLSWSVKDDGTIIAGMIFNDTQIKKTGVEIARIFFIIDSGMFEEVIQSKTDSTIIICNDIGQVALSNNMQYPKNDYLWNCSIELNNFVYDSELDNQTISIDNEKYLAVKYKSIFMDWYFVRFIEIPVLMKDVRKITIVSLFIGICAFLIIIFIYVVMIRHLFAPMKDIRRAMERVAANDFNIRLDIHTKDEFAIVANGFNHMVCEIEKLVNDIKRSGEEKAKLSIEALQYQINPHFLYNVLAAIRFIALNKKENDVADMLMKLNRLFRMKLRNAGGEITLEEDVKTMKDYTDLLNLRYNNMIQFEFDISENSKDCKIPGFILQPLIENAVMHGVAPKLMKGTCIVRISAECVNDELHILIYDNGVGIGEEQIRNMLDCVENEGIGFTNIVKKLNYTYKDNVKISINSKVGEFTQIHISIKEHKIS